MLVFKKADLLTPNPSRNWILYETGRAHVQETLKALRMEGDYSDFESLSRAASSCIQRNKYNVDAIAAEAGISLRMAQRVAASRRTSLHALLNEARLSKSKALILGDPSMTFSEVAERTGYSDERAFRRFFKRMTGLSPSQYRSLLQSG